MTPTGAAALRLHPALLAKAGYGFWRPSFARTADGALHVALESSTNWEDSFNGVGAWAISPSGHVGPEVQALSWNASTPGSPNGIPGLAAPPGGALEATFGGSPSGDDGPWGISSTNGGITWSAPVDVGSGSMEFGDANVPLAVSNGTPVLAAGCCGGIVIQQGFGPGAPTSQITNSNDNTAGNLDIAVDAASGAVIASWDSAGNVGGYYWQQVAPTLGTAEKAPINGTPFGGIPLILAGRDSGPGVFAAFPANNGNTSRIRLLRYGGGSVPIGSVRGLHADTWGAATGKDGRIWVMWFGYGPRSVNGKGIIAVTRSNEAATRFEPVQQYGFQGSVSTLNGDGRLGPLDLLINGAPPGVPEGIYYARILPELSASVSVKAFSGGKFKLKVKVTDAGDAIKGATASTKGQSATTNSNGKAKLAVSGSSGAHVTVTISDSGYNILKETVTL